MSIRYGGEVSVGRGKTIQLTGVLHHTPGSTEMPANWQVNYLVGFRGDAPKNVGHGTLDVRYRNPQVGPMGQFAWLGDEVVLDHMTDCDPYLPEAPGMAEALVWAALHRVPPRSLVWWNTPPHMRDFALSNGFEQVPYLDGPQGDPTAPRPLIAPAEEVLGALRLAVPQLVELNIDQSPT